MFFSSVLRYALFLLVPLSSIFSFYLYLYPVFHLCAFPSPESNTRSEYVNTLRHHTPFPPRDATKIAPFRLLALGDPQLEGESSIRDVEAASFPHLTKFWDEAIRRNGRKNSHLQQLRQGLHDLIDFYLDDIPKSLEVYRKRFDHFGNDYYLGHIYRTMHWWTNPTHVTVLGDLVGSQWIDDDEFDERGWRFWNRVFRGGVKISDELASRSTGDLQDMVLGENAADWKQRIINVAGNHDVGYAGDLSPERIARFTRVFGKDNYELRFQYPVNSSTVPIEGSEEEEYRPVPELRIVVLNDMNLDTPAGSQEMQDDTYSFLNSIITNSEDVNRPAHFTLVLTHIPMYKQAGVCVDGPFFDYFSNEFANGVKEQNHLSKDASKGLLEGIFGMSGHTEVPGAGFGRHGVVLTGHDHEGCNVYHYINQSSPAIEREWQATTWPNAVANGLDDIPGMPGLREITVQSMMGGFAGNAGLMSLWFDEETWDWQFGFTNCGLGTQHIWWLVHILDLITLGVGLVYGAMVMLRFFGTGAKVEGLANGPAKQRLEEPQVTSNGAASEGHALLRTQNGSSEANGTGKHSLRKKKSTIGSQGSSLNGFTP